MEYLYFALLVLCLCSCVLAALTEGFMIGIVGMAITLVIFCTPIFSHNHDVTVIKFSSRIVKVETDYAKGIRRQLDSVPSADVTLMNADSPVSVMVSELAKSELRIRDARQKVLQAEFNIEKRKRFITAYALWFI